MKNESPDQVKTPLFLIVGGSLLLLCLVISSFLFPGLWFPVGHAGQPVATNLPAASHLTAVPTHTALPFASTRSADPDTTAAPPATSTPPSLPTEEANGRGTATPEPTPTMTPTPTVIPTEVPLLQLGEDTVVIALLGTDEEQTPGTYRTDAIILAFVQPDARRVSLLSVPRDLWVYVPGHGYDRINTVDIIGGLPLLDRTFRYNLGVPVHHYARVNLTGFARIVDTMGGVTVDVQEPLTDKIPDPLSPSGWFELALEKGPQHLDGVSTLAYCRSRLTTSDFDRSRRQRQVLLALWQQAFTVDTLGQVPELWTTLGESFDTDLTVAQGVQMAQAMVGLDAQSVRSASLSGAIEQWTTPEGAWVLLLKPDLIRQTILDLLS